MPEEKPRPVLLAALLWLGFLATVAVDVFYIRRTRSLFEAMYEGLGSTLPSASRFFLNPLSHLAAFVAIPLLGMAIGIAWRLRPKAGIAALVAAIVLAMGWGITYRWAMKLPIEALEHGFGTDK